MASSVKKKPCCGLCDAPVGAAKRIVELESQLAEAKDALEELVDHQNGPPLPTWTPAWNRAMAKACKVLGRTWEYVNG